MPDDNRFNDELEVAVAAATQAGTLLRDFFESDNFTVDEKQLQGEGQGLVTQADLESEKLIIERIKKAFPEHQFLAEESVADQETENHDFLWVIDPLDGTNNFAHHIPHFAVSIAFYHEGKSRVGVIYDPMRNDLFTTVKGQGARHNGKPVSVNNHSTLTQTMLAVGFYYDRGDMMKQTLASIEKIFEQNVHGIRRMGTAALDLVQVGLGRFGGYFEYTLSPWDFAAAQLFVEEAGGTVTTCDGEPLPLQKSSVLASNSLLHESILNLVKR